MVCIQIHCSIVQLNFFFRFISPKCRVKVIGKKKNVVVNGLLEAYLKAFPHKRPEPKTIDKPMPAKYQVGTRKYWSQSRLIPFLDRSRWNVYR